MESLKENVVIDKNKITIKDPEPKSHHYILLSHHQNTHAYLIKSILINSFPIQLTTYNIYVLQLQIMNKSLIKSKPPYLPIYKEKTAQDLKVIHITQYLTSIDGYVPELQELSPQNILTVLEAMKPYGEMKSLKIQGHTIIMTYEKSFNIKKRFIIPKQQEIKSSKLYYFVLSEDLPYSYRHKKLLSLPIQSQIQEIKIHHNWLISRNKENILFVGLTQPFDNVQVVTLPETHSILTMFPQKFVLCAYKYLHIYTSHHSIKQEFVVKLRGLSAYSFVRHEDNCIFGGINHQSKLAFSISPSKNRHLYVVNNFYKINFKIQKSITPDRLIYVCQAKEPITMLHFISDLSSIACYCEKKMYIVSLNEELLAQASVEHMLSFITYIPYPFNLVNYLGMMDKHILRVGLDIYNNQVGLELQQFKSFGNINCITYADAVYVSDTHIMAKCDLLAETKTKIVVTKQPILFLTGSGKILIYVVSNLTAYSFHYVLLP